MLLLGFPLGFFASGSFKPDGRILYGAFSYAATRIGQGFSYKPWKRRGRALPDFVGFFSARLSAGNFDRGISPWWLTGNDLRSHAAA